jgi:hypothetical protein
VRPSLYLTLAFFFCLTALMVLNAEGDYLLVKDVLSTSGGHLESSSYLLDYSTGQTAVGLSQGTSHIESGGFWSWSPWGEVVGVEDEAWSDPLPDRFELSQNYPNPFNPETRIRYRLPQTAHVDLSVYNVMGQVVCRLVDRQQAAGEHVIIWNGRDEAGRPAASGIYFYRLVSGEFHQTRKMLLLK